MFLAAAIDPNSIRRRTARCNPSSNFDGKPEPAPEGSEIGDFSIRLRGRRRQPASSWSAVGVWNHGLRIRGLIARPAFRVISNERLILGLACYPLIVELSCPVWPVRFSSLPQTAYKPRRNIRKLREYPTWIRRRANRSARYAGWMWRR